MKSKLTVIDETSVKMDVVISPADVVSVVDKVYEDISSHLKVPGFRKGKIPRQIINQRVGTGFLIEEVTNQAINKFYQKAALEQDLKVMGQPEVEVTKPYSPLSVTEDIEFLATVDVRPKIELPKIEGREVKVKLEPVDTKKVDERLEYFRHNSATKNEDGTEEIPDDEELAAILSVDSVKDLKAKIKDELEKGQLGAVVGNAGDQLLEAILKDVKIPLPKKAVDSQVEYFFEQQKKDGKKPTDEERKTAEKRAESDIRSQVLLDTYADENDIKVGQEEIINYLSNTAYQYGIDPNQFVQMMVQQGQLPMAAAEVSRSKTLAHMLRRVKVADEKGKTLDLTPWIGQDEDKAQDKTPKKAPVKKAVAKKAPVRKTAPAKTATKVATKEDKAK